MPSFGDALQRGVELIAAITAVATEHVTSQAFAVHAHEHVVLALHRARHKGDVLGRRDQAIRRHNR